MRFFYLFYIIFIFQSLKCESQLVTRLDEKKKLPYHELPETPEKYNEVTVVSRIIDGLGFRFYWASDGLKKEDLKYRPDASSRSIIETIRHIHAVTELILNPISGKENEMPLKEQDLNYKELRRLILINLKKASDIIKTKDSLENCSIIFKKGNQKTTFPFWYSINGPISDAIWHSGQISTMRRAAGNPMNSSVNPFLGRTIK